MKFNKLIIENFLTVGRIEANLRDKGLVLVCGENQDDSSQDSNGSGKSSFVDALCFALYGQTARGVSGDAVINDTAGNSCRVIVEIDIDGDVYTITRHRKYPKKRNRLEVTDPTGADLTLGTDKLTQVIVDKLMGATADVFCASVYSGQENTPDLPGMTDIHLKAIVEEAAGINQLEEAHKLARDRKNAIQKECDTEINNLNFKMQRLSDLKDDLDAAKPSLENWEIDHLDAVDAAKKRVVEAKKAHDESQKAFALNRSIDEIDEDIKALTDQLAGSRAESSNLSKLEAEASKIAGDKSGIARMVADQVAKAKSLKAKLDAVSDQIGQPCSECGRDHDSSTLGSAESLVKADLKNAVLTLKGLKEDLAVSTELHKTALEAASKFRDTMIDVSEGIALQSKLSSEKADTVVSKSLTERTLADFKRAAIDYKALAAQVNPHIEGVKVSTERIKVTEQQIKDLKVKVEGIEYNLEVAKEAVHVFGPAGVRAHILDNVTPLLNEKTSEYLTILSDGNIQAVWNTLGETSKGEIREKFNIEVSSSTGGDSFRKLSGGEKRKVRLATSMALQDLVSSRATKPIDLFIADEVDAAIDESGLERLMTILKNKAEQVGTVLVISHSDLKSWISDSVTIVKTAGVARLTGHAL